MSIGCQVLLSLTSLHIREHFWVNRIFDFLDAMPISEMTVLDKILQINLNKEQITIEMLELWFCNHRL